MTESAPSGRTLAALASLIVALGASAPVSRGATSIAQCPSEIPAESVQVANPPAGWTPFTDSTLYLSFAELMDGPPSMRGDLVPYSTVERKSSSTVTFKFEGPYPNGKWLRCGYGDGGEVTLSREIPSSVAECVLHFTKGKKAGSRDVRVDCK